MDGGNSMVSPYLSRPLRSLREALEPDPALPQRRPDLADAQASGESPAGRPLGSGEAQTARPEAVTTR